MAGRDLKDYSNRAIADILHEMASLYEMLGVEFKPAAYEKAALNIESHTEKIADIYNAGGVKALEEIPGIGGSIAEHIRNLLESGHFKEYETLKKKLPVQINELTAVEGIGPKTVRKLWQELGISNLDELEKATRNGQIRELPGFGQKSEQRILKAIEFLQSASGRSILGFVLSDIRRLEETIADFPEVEQIAIAGSARRYKETIGDVDIVVTSDKPDRVMERFVELPDISHVYGQGQTKTNVRLVSGLDTDLRVVPAASWGAALCYFTGSKAHNISLRNIAIKKGWKLNEYGIYKNEKQLAGRTENAIYKKLGLEYVEPELREDRGEIMAAREHKLPRLIGYEDLRGDLQIQSNWTDGKNSIKEMALAAEAAGLEYIVITDHTRSLAMANGLDEKRLTRQMAEIDKINKKLDRQGHNITILKGAEVNIMKNGSLDIEDDVLAKLDVAGAAIHSYFELSRKEQTARVVRAMNNPNVDILFHPTARLINRRRPIDLDSERVIGAALKTGTVMEIDAYPARLDINDELIKRCVETGVKLAIDSDAHAAEHFSYLTFGIAQARRGWAERKDVINCWPLKKMLRFLKQ